jgi:hypothetical protein
MSNILANNINPRSGTSIDVGGALQVGSATTIHTTGIDLGSGNIQSHNINSTGIITATSASFSGDVSIGGTLTYEDVTSIDSVGIITARSGLKVSSGITTISGTLAVNGNNYPSTGPLSHRNIIINGAMTIAQRNTSVNAITGTNIYTCDRMQWTLNNCGEWSNTQETNGPNGFGYSFKAMCAFGDSSPAADDYALLQYMVESTDLQHLKYGTSDAVPMTISFYVKSNKTGAASFAMLQMENSGRTFAKPYTINAADTWEYKTITIPADTSGNFLNGNGNGLLLEWWCNSGSNFTGGTYPSTWFAQDDNNRNASNIGIGQATDDYFQITGIQLEVGEVATPFETRPISEELLRCQRYFIRQDWVAANALHGTTYRWISPGPNVNMRATPALAYFNPSTGTANQTFEHSSGTVRTINSSPAALSATNGPTVYFQTSTNGTYAQYVRIHINAEF